MNRLLPLAAVLALASCARHPPPPTPSPHYVVGPAWQGAFGTWFYPREDFGYDATGLAERLPGHAGLTADGEVYDPAAVAGAHQTLQLPTVARVTNFENGRQILLRLNDRGPADPGRILGLTPRAADLLGVGAGPGQVRLQVESAPSQALRDRLGGGPKGATAAPRASVAAESLPPPPGIAVSARYRVGPGETAAPATAETDSAAPDRLPDTVEQLPPHPGQLWIEAGRFSRPTYANRLASSLSTISARVEREPGASSLPYRVMAGPFPSVQAADAALDRVRRAGVTDATIVVE